MEMMASAIPFQEALENVLSLSKQRDPRLVRLASVTSAVKDVSGGNPSPVKFYASVIETLEGTLHESNQSADTILDVICTQSAVVDLIGLVLGHVSPSTVSATFRHSANALTNVVQSHLSFATEGRQGSISGTHDGLGGVVPLLCSVCKTSSILLRRLDSISDGKAVSRLLRKTLLVLVTDSRSNVKGSATSELCSLLADTSSVCHGMVLKETTQHVKGEINICSIKSGDQQSQRFVGVLGFLQNAIPFLDYTNIGTQLMEHLMEVASRFSSSSAEGLLLHSLTQKNTRDVLKINAILSTILVILENESIKSTETSIRDFSARVLASLVRMQPSHIYRHGKTDNDIITGGLVIFGQVVLSSCQCILNYENADTALKLLPVAVGCIVELCKPAEASTDIGVSTLLMPELSQVFRTYLTPLKKSHDALFEKCCKDSLFAMKALLGHSFQETWTVSLQPLVILLQLMHPSDTAAQDCIQTIICLRCEITDTVAQHCLDDSLTSYIQGMGIEQFWKHLKLSEHCFLTDPETPKLSLMITSNLPWLLQLLKSAGSIGGDYAVKLSFFHHVILPLAKYFDSKRGSNIGSGDDRYRDIVVSLWHLLPIFCRCPDDLDESFSELVPLLLGGMKDKSYPELIDIVCAGLVILSNSVSERCAELEELCDDDEARKIRADFNLIQKATPGLIPSLFKLAESVGTMASPKVTAGMESHFQEVDRNHFDGQTLHNLTEAIACLARLSPPETVKVLFSKVLKRLLNASQAEDDLSDAMCTLLTLSQALVISGSLDHSSVSLLYRSLKPLIRSDETRPRVQKRAYRVLGEICARYGSFISDNDNVRDVLELLTSSMTTSQVSSRFMRLKCLTLIVKSFERRDMQEQEMMLGLLGEGLLCLKDSNGKTREAAFGLILSISSSLGDLGDFLRSMMAAVGSVSSHMRSAAIIALSRVLFERKDDSTVQLLLPSILQTVLLLSDDPSREVVKSFVGFVRIAVVIIPVESLRPLLPDILHSLLKYHRGKDRFRSKIKIILKKLVRSFGYQTLTPLVPVSESRLLTHMRKLSEREERRKIARRREKDERVSQFDDMVASDEEDSDDGKTLLTSATSMSRSTKTNARLGKRNRSVSQESGTVFSTKSGKTIATTLLRIKNDVHGSEYDVGKLTDRAVRFAEPNDDDSDFGTALPIDSAGRLIIQEDSDSINGAGESWETREDNIEKGHLSHLRSKATGSNTKNKEKRSNQKLGSAYKARAAGGDVKRKGQKYDPYAYVPLDGRSYTKKNRTAAIEQMQGVVNRGTKRQKR